MKKFFVFDIEWSHTDKETVIIQETCKATAEARLKSLYKEGYRYISFVRVSETFID